MIMILAFLCSGQQDVSKYTFIIWSKPQFFFICAPGCAHEYVPFSYDSQKNQTDPYCSISDSTFSSRFHQVKSAGNRTIRYIVEEGDLSMKIFSEFNENRTTIALIKEWKGILKHPNVQIYEHWYHLNKPRVHFLP